MIDNIKEILLILKWSNKKASKYRHIFLSNYCAIFNLLVHIFMCMSIYSTTTQPQKNIIYI
jgi:hypothetical protein